MGFGELLFLAVGLSMDAFAVSICKGLSVPKATLRQGFVCGLWFGGFQALMPVIGFYLGNILAGAIMAFDHWIAFGLLVIIGVNMLKEAFQSSCGIDPNSGNFSPKAMFPMAVATSVDALAVGISLAMVGTANIWLSVTLIGVVTFILSALGVKLGNLLGCRFQKRAQLAGGGILILLGVKILLEHLGVL